MCFIICRTCVIEAFQESSISKEGCCNTPSSRKHTSLKTKKTIIKVGWTVFPKHHTAQNLLPQTSPSLESTEIPSMGKGLGVMAKLLQK